MTISQIFTTGSMQNELSSGGYVGSHIGENDVSQNPSYAAASQVMSNKDRLEVPKKTVEKFKRRKENELMDNSIPDSRSILSRSRIGSLFSKLFRKKQQWQTRKPRQVTPGGTADEILIKGQISNVDVTGGEAEVADGGQRDDSWRHVNVVTQRPMVSVGQRPGSRVTVPIKEETRPISANVEDPWLAVINNRQQNLKKTTPISNNEALAKKPAPGTSVNADM